MDAVAEVARTLFTYETPAKINYAFAFWTVFYLTLNIAWDILSSKTPPWSMSQLREKADTVFQAGTFAGGILLFLAAFQSDMRAALMESNFALGLPGLVCLLHSLSNISPVGKKDRPRIF